MSDITNKICRESIIHSRQEALKGAKCLRIPCLDLVMGANSDVLNLALEDEISPLLDIVSSARLYTIEKNMRSEYNEPKTTISRFWDYTLEYDGENIGFNLGSLEVSREKFASEKKAMNGAYALNSSLLLFNGTNYTKNILVYIPSQSEFGSMDKKIMMINSINSKLAGFNLDSSGKNVVEEVASRCSLYRAQNLYMVEFQTKK